jgi:hypothetical protein
MTQCRRADSEGRGSERQCVSAWQGSWNLTTARQNGTGRKSRFGGTLAVGWGANQVAARCLRPSRWWGLCPKLVGFGPGSLCQNGAGSGVQIVGVRDRKAACQDGLRLGGAGRPPWKQRRPEPVKVPTSGCGGRGWPPGANRAGRSAGLPPPAVLLGVIQPVADHLQLEEEVLLLVRFSGTAAVL